MKKQYSEPMAEVMTMTVEDIVTASSGAGGAGGPYEGPSVDL